MFFAKSRNRYQTVLAEMSGVALEITLCNLKGDRTLEAVRVSEWAHAIEGCLAWLIAGGASVATVKLRRNYLLRLAVAIPAGPWTATFDDLLGFVARPGWSPETRKSVRAAIRSLYRYGMDTGKISVDPSAKLPPVRVPKGLPRPAPLDVLTDALLRADRRGRLMLLLAALAGMRRAEIACTHTDDIIGDVLWLKGKGGRVRKIPLHPLIMDEIGYLPAGFLFPGRIDGHLSPNRVGVILSELLPGKWTAHTLRHQLAGRFHAANHDTLALQRLLGHARAETTERYTDIPVDSLRTALFAAVATA